MLLCNGGMYKNFGPKMEALPDLTSRVREGIINIRIGRCRQTGGPSWLSYRSNRLVGSQRAVTSFC